MLDNLGYHEEKGQSPDSVDVISVDVISLADSSLKSAAKMCLNYINYYWVVHNNKTGYIATIVEENLQHEWIGAEVVKQQQCVIQLEQLQHGTGIVHGLPIHIIWFVNTSCFGHCLAPTTPMKAHHAM